MVHAECDIDLLREYIRYDQWTGDLFWIKKSGKKSVVGDRPGYRRKDGRGVICFQYKRFLSSRMAWALHHGEWPAVEIDHRDGDPSNDRIENLRLATSSQQKRKRASRTNSGFKGVYFLEDKGVFRAQVKIGNKTKFLGHFTDAEEANRVRIQAEIDLGVREFSRAA